VVTDGERPEGNDGVAGGATRPDAGPAGSERPLGRRVFLGIVALGAAGVLVGARVQSALTRALGPSLSNLLPGGEGFRIYSITGTYPSVAPEAYRLEVSGLVERPVTLTMEDLKKMPSTSVVRTFQCVTGWQVPDVEWRGVTLSHLLDAVGVKQGAVAITFDSYDGADTESLTLDQARRPDVLVAYEMLGAPVTTEHGGPVRLYVAPMFGYKSLKWLSAIRVVDRVEPGFWEMNGYPVNAWRDGSTGETNTNPAIA